MKKIIIILPIIIIIIVLFLVVNLITGYNEATSFLVNQQQGIDYQSYCSQLSEVFSAECIMHIAYYNNDSKLCEKITGFRANEYQLACNETFDKGSYEFRQFIKDTGTYLGLNYDKFSQECNEKCDGKGLKFINEVSPTKPKSLNNFSNRMPDSYVDEIYSCYCFSN